MKKTIFLILILTGAIFAQTTDSTEAKYQQQINLISAQLEKIDAQLYRLEKQREALINELTAITAILNERKAKQKIDAKEKK